MDIGKKSKMERLAASLAKEACDKSFCEVEANGIKRKCRSAPSNDAESGNQSTQSPKRIKTSKLVHHGALEIIQALNEQNPEMPIGNLEENDSVAASHFVHEPNLIDASSSTNIIAQKDKEIEDLRQQLVKERTKLLRLQKTRYVDQTDLQEFDNGLKVPKALVDSIRDRYRGSPSQFLRAMMDQTGIFTLEEIANHSVYGRKSSVTPEILRPPLPRKFITLKEFVITECRLERGSASFIKFESSVRGICSDVRKRLKMLKHANEKSV